MNHKDFQKIIRANKMGKLTFTYGNLLFDPNYSFPRIDELESAMDWAREQLSWWAYSKRSDCNRYHTMLRSRMIEWFQKNTGYPYPVAIAGVWGVFNDEHHFWVVAFTATGMHHINYGHFDTPSQWKIEGSFWA